MGFVRRVCRVTALCCWFFLTMGIVMVINRSKGWDGVARAVHWTRIWARGACRLAGVHVEVIGDPDAFPGGLIVGNHQGYLDILSHASIFKIRFAPKIEMKRWPVLGYMTSLNRPVWIDRTSRQKSREAAEQMMESLRHHVSMLVYPEGTSTDGKHGLLPFKSTPFEAAAAVGLPIQPTLLFFESTPVSEPLAWYGDARLLPHAWRVLGLKEVRVKAYILPQITPLPGEPRKELAVRVHDLMEKEYWRIRNHG